MSDLAPCSRKSEVNSTRLYNSVTSKNLEKQSSSPKNHMATNDGADLTSPISPVSAISPSSSEHSFMSISPVSPTYKSIWQSHNAAKLRPSLSKGNATMSSARLDRDGDVSMLSPNNQSPREDSWESTTTSRILGRLVGIPFRPTSIDSAQRDCAERDRSTTVTQATTTPTRPKLQIPEHHKAQIEHSIQHLGHPLVPLIAADTCLPHPEFPRSILQYHLLTHNQLDSLARWYHQTVDNNYERYLYPCPIDRPWVWSMEQQQVRQRQAISQGSEVQEVELSTKRRRFGRFIGLRGCETPNEEESQEALAERMEQEWRAAMKKAAEDEQVQEKMWRGRW